jgi:probable HAF family extracellular repeat protein
MKNNAKFFRKIIAVVGIALLLVGITRTSRADDRREFADEAKFTTIDFPGATGTAAFGINLQREIVGTHNHFSCCPFNINSHGFLLSDGKFASFDVPGASPNSTQPNGINLQGEIVGSYGDSSGKSHGFLLRHGTFSTVDPPGTTFTFANGINLQGDIVGFYTDSDANGHGFLLKNGRFTTIGTWCCGSRGGDGSARNQPARRRRGGFQ